MHRSAVAALAALAAALALRAAPALSGPWPREEGRTFLALGAEVSSETTALLDGRPALRQYHSLYVERGLARALTLGLDAAWGAGRDDHLLSLLLFLRRPVWQGSRDIAAAGIGLGLEERTGEGLRARIRPGLSIGRGIATAWGDGWLALDGSAELLLPGADALLKLDATAGLKPRPGLMLILQVQSSWASGAEPVLKLAPSLVREVAPGRHLQLEVSAGLAGDRALAVKLGAWAEF